MVAGPCRVERPEQPQVGEPVLCRHVAEQPHPVVQPEVVQTERRSRWLRRHHLPPTGRGQPPTLPRRAATAAGRTGERRQPVLRSNQAGLGTAGRRPAAIGHHAVRLPRASWSADTPQVPHIVSELPAGDGGRHAPWSGGSDLWKRQQEFRSALDLVDDQEFGGVHESDRIGDHRCPVLSPIEIAALGHTIAGDDADQRALACLARSADQDDAGVREGSVDLRGGAGASPCRRSGPAARRGFRPPVGLPVSVGSVVRRRRRGDVLRRLLLRCGADDEQAVAGLGAVEPVDALAVRRCSSCSEHWTRCAPSWPRAPGPVADRSRSHTRSALKNVGSSGRSFRPRRVHLKVTVDVPTAGRAWVPASVRRQRRLRRPNAGLGLRGGGDVGQAVHGAGDGVRRVHDVRVR